MNELLAYLPMDRRHAMAQGRTLPDRAYGATLFADISGFTPLTAALVEELGAQRGAEELTRYLNLVYDAIINEVHRFGGSVIAFAGDAITCWLSDDDGRRATACALAMQNAIQPFATVSTPGGSTVSLAMKAAVATGEVRRFLVGDPTQRVIDALAGETLVRLANAEHQAQRGETVIDGTTLSACTDIVEVQEMRHDAALDQQVGVVARLRTPVAASPWPPLDTVLFTEEQVRPWLLPQVYTRLQHGLGNFLAELRPTVAFFLRFAGIDYDADAAAGQKLDSYIRWVQTIVDRYEGTLIDLNIGDKGSYLYINFGAPVAHENNADRAAATALALMAQPEHLRYIAPVQIGISQGRMRAGAYGGSHHRTYGVLGNEVNMAARFMMAAKPGQILLSQAAQRSLSQAFVVEALPPIRVKGKDEPVDIFALQGTQQIRGAQLTAPTYALPMIGRQAELAQVAERLALAAQGHGQMVGIVGEAGLGKSRLVAEVVRLAVDHGFATYGGECESYGLNSAYLVWQPIWRGIYGIEGSWPRARQIRELAYWLQSINPALGARLPLLGAVLNIEIPDNTLTRSFDAKLRKTSLEALLIDCLQAMARRSPLLIVLEDCHWLDPLSQDLLEAIGNAIADVPVLLVLAYRPLEQAQLRSIRVHHLPHYTEIQLAPLTPTETTQFVSSKLAQLSGAATVAQSLATRLATQADGNPFYIEELINYLHARAIDFSDSAALEKVDLPDSLQRLVLALIDQLSESQKITVKVASVIGRVFRAAWLPGVYADLGDIAHVHTDLEILRRLELMLLERTEPELVYFFRQVITQGVTYESLPHAMKALLHEQIGLLIEERYPETLDQYLDLLAYHYDRSANHAKQCEYLRKAGEAAQAAYANTTAIDYYQRLLPLLPEAEQTPILLKLGQVLELVGQWHEAEELSLQALTLAQRLGERPALAQAQRALGGLRRKQGDYNEALQWMEQARTTFAQENDPAGVSYLWADIGEVYRLQGNYADAQGYYEESLQLAATVPTTKARLAVRAHALKGAGTVATWQGDYTAARLLNEESLAIRRELGDKPGAAALLNNLGIVARFQRDLMSAYQMNEEGIALFRELGDRWSLGALLNNQACIASDLGNYAEARGFLQECLEIRRQLADKAGLALSLNTLADVVLDEGDYGAARPLLVESLQLSRELGDQTAIAYLLEDFGGLAAFEGQPQRALHLAGFAAALREIIGAPLPPAEQARVDRMLQAAHKEITADVAAAALAKGRQMSLEDAIDYALDAAE